MLNLVAQTTDYTTTYDLSSGDTTGFALFGGVFLLVWLLLAAVIVVSMWKVFEKAGKPGWAAIVPVYNGWVMAEIAGKPGWWGIVPLLGVIPLIGFIGAIAGFVHDDEGVVLAHCWSTVWALGIRIFAKILSASIIA